MSFLTNLGFVAVGSAVGGCARYCVDSIVVRVAGQTFPWGTLLVNLSGCLFLGWFSTFIRETFDGEQGGILSRDHWWALLAIGVAGGYTTFSSFERETFALFHDGRSWSGIFYVTGSVFVGLVAFRGGMLLAGAD